MIWGEKILLFMLCRYTILMYVMSLWQGVGFFSGGGVGVRRDAVKKKLILFNWP